jgi:hypothetical protein
MQFEDIRMILCRPAGAFRVLSVDRGLRLPPATLCCPSGSGVEEQHWTGCGQQ